MSEPLPGTYPHQCRYCAHCVFTMFNTWWCDEQSEDIHSPMKANKCEKFLFIKYSADANERTGEFHEYRPRRKKNFTQPRLFEMPTDAQRKRMEGKK